MRGSTTQPAYSVSSLCTELWLCGDHPSPSIVLPHQIQDNATSLMSYLLFLKCIMTYQIKIPILHTLYSLSEERAYVSCSLLDLCTERRRGNNSQNAGRTAVLSIQNPNLRKSSYLAELYKNSRHCAAWPLLDFIHPGVSVKQQADSCSRKQSISQNIQTRLHT